MLYKFIPLLLADGIQLKAKILDDGTDNFVRVVLGNQPGDFRIAETDTVECLELLPEVLFQVGAVSVVGLVVVFQALELADEAVFDDVFPNPGTGGVRRQIIRGLFRSRHMNQRQFASGIRLSKRP